MIDKIDHEPLENQPYFPKIHTKPYRVSLVLHAESVDSKDQFLLIFLRKNNNKQQKIDQFKMSDKFFHSKAKIWIKILIVNGELQNCYYIESS